MKAYDAPLFSYATFDLLSNDPGVRAMTATALFEQYEPPADPDPEPVAAFVGWGVPRVGV